MTLDHDEARGLASQALDEPLDHDSEQGLALHLVSCPACKMFYDNLQRASDAVRRSVRGTLPEEALGSAVHRATTVLGGEADPAAATAEAEEPAPVPTGAPPVPADAPPGPPAPDEPPPPAGERDAFADALYDLESDDVEPGEADAATPSDVTPPDATTVDAPPAEPAPSSPSEPVLEPPGEPGAPETEAADQLEGAEEPPEAEVIAPPAPEAGYGTEDLGGPPPGDTGLRWRTGPTAVAIAATLAVAVLAAFLVLNRSDGGPEPEGDLPTVEEVRNGIGTTFDDLVSLEASYSISRLSLYRVRTEENRIVFSFSNAEQTGRIAFESELRLRQEHTLEIPIQVAGGEGESRTQAIRSTVVRTPEELRTLTQDGEAETATAIANYPLAPPEGELIPRLGVLEEAVGSVARMIQDSRELEVVGREVQGSDEAGQDEVVRVRIPVSPSPFTRADRIEALLDARTFFPLEIRRTLPREEAEVLGPAEILTQDAIDSAYQDLDRITTEHVTIENLQLDEVILPGEFAMDIPPEVETETVDAGYEHDVSRGEVPSVVPFTPMLPTDLPTGFREQSFAALTGEPTAWGPDDAYPAPSGILETLYSDGKTTIVLSQREQPDGPFEVPQSPLATEGEPLATRTLVRGGIQLTYAISPEIPPHVYGFVGDVFVVVSGYVPQADLLRIASSLEEIPDLDGDGTGASEVTDTESE